MVEETTQQEIKTVTPPELRNPAGKGGFADHPEHRSPGGWKKENTFSYQMNRFKNMTIDELQVWNTDTPNSRRTVAEDLAFKRVFAAQNDLAEFKEVADRTEGKAKQVIEQEIDVNVTSNKEVAARLQDVLEIEENTTVDTSVNDVIVLPQDPTKPMEF
jgi:hypothetical protein